MKIAFSFIFSKLQFFFVLLFLASIQTNLANETWEGWRGLEKQANSKSKNTIKEWSKTENVLWKAELIGEGHSSPVVSDEFVFISSAERVYEDITTGKILINLFMVYSILIFVSILYKIQYKVALSKVSFFNNTCTYILFGIILFCFLVLYWMYFHEKQVMADRKLTYWFFSGSFVIFLYLLTISRIPISNIFRTLLAMLVLPFISYLIFKRPFPDYYFIYRLFDLENVTFTIFILLSVYLPAISIFHFFVKTVRDNKYSEKNKIAIPGHNKSYRIYYSGFLFGLSGLLIAPLIALAKICYRKSYNGAPVCIGLTEIFDYTFPYFLIVLMFGYILWYIIEKNQQNTLSITKKWIFFSLLFISVGIFVLLNFKTTDVVYERSISCYNKMSGELLWKTKGLKGEAIMGSNYNSQATPTPVIKDNKICAYFGSAGMMCVDFYGKLLWVNKELPFIGLHGVGASPVKSEHDFIICNQMPTDPFIAAINAETGNFRWKKKLTKRNGEHCEFRTPMVLSIDGIECVLEWFGAGNELRFYSTKDGTILKKCKLNWRYGGEAIASPIISGDTLFLAHKLGIHAVSVKNLFDGELHAIWSTELKAKGPDTSSPVKAGNRIFLISDDGIATCVDCRNGKILWQERLNGMFYASIIADASNIYYMDTKSKITIIKNSTSFSIVAQNELDNLSSSTPVIVDDKILIRTSKTLWCIGKPMGSEVTL